MQVVLTNKKLSCDLTPSLQQSVAVSLISNLTNHKMRCPDRVANGHEENADANGQVSALLFNLYQR